MTIGEHVLQTFRIHFADGHSLIVKAYEPQEAGRKAMRQYACAVVAYERMARTAGRPHQERSNHGQG